MNGFFSLLHTLLFPKVKKELEELTNSLAPLPGLHPTLKLPRIIVVGDENSGKSSILERICGLEVLPRGEGITTRLATLLCLQHDLAATTPVISVTLPGQPSQTGLTATQARELVEKENSRIRDEGPGIDIDNMVTIGVRSAQALTIDLVDLPGIIAIQVEQRLADLSKACTKKYLDDPETGVVVCVLDANAPNLRASSAVRLIQDSSHGIQARTIGVFTRVDDAQRWNWKQEVGGTGPLWKLEKLLLKDLVQFPDYKPIFSAMGGGFVAVKNRNTQSISQVDLGTSVEDEMNWLMTRSAFTINGPKAFLQPIANNLDSNGSEPEPEAEIDDASSAAGSFWECLSGIELTPLGKMHLGLAALMTRIDMMFNRHLNESWVPGELAKNAQERERLQLSLAALGKDPIGININDCGDFLPIVKAKITAVFTPAKIDALCESPLFNLGETFSWELLGNNSRRTRMAAIVKLQEHMEHHLCGGSSALVAAFAASLAQEVKVCFDTDIAGDWQLHRFHELRDLLAGSILADALQHGEDFGAKALTVIQMLLLTLRVKLPHMSGEETRLTLESALADCLMEFVALQVLELPHNATCFAFLEAHLTALNAPNPLEACAATRLDLQLRLKKTEEFDRVISTLGQSPCDA